MHMKKGLIIFALFLASLIIGVVPSFGQADDIDLDGFWDGIEEKIAEPWTEDQISEISIGMIETGQYTFPYNRLTGLGFDVFLISPDSGLSTFEDYDVIYLPTGWADASAGDYATIESNASDYRSFVNSGGGLFIDQPNPYMQPSERVTPTLLPYPITFYNPYNSSDVRIIVDDRHDITQGLPASEMPFPADQMESVDSRYHILVRGSVTNSPSLVIAGYGRGKILVQSGHSAASSITPFSDEVYIRMVEWVGPIWQTVYLDFTDFTTTQYGVNRTTAINSITAAMQRDYGDFRFLFETTEPDGVYSTVDLGGDSTPGLYGRADQLDLGNAQKFDDALSFTDEWDDQQPTLYDNLTALTNTVSGTSSHELGHILGHTHYSPTPLGAGLQAGNDEPNWPDVTTNFHIMATFHSGCDHPQRAERNRYFGRREWRDLEMNERSYGTNVIEEQTGSHGSTATAQGLSTFAGRRIVIGDISSGGELDYYSQIFSAGDIVDIRTYSELIHEHVGQLGDLVGRISNIIDPVLELRNSSGTLVASNDDFYGSGTDATILEYVVPSTSTYYIVVKAYSSADTGGYELYIDRTNFNITETEPNDNVATAQVISAPGFHRGYCETAEEGPLTIGWGGDDLEDVYEFTLSDTWEVTIQLDPTVFHYSYDWTEPSIPDLDLVLFESDLSILASGFSGTNGATETLTRVLDPGTYYIGVTAYDPEEVYSEYRLDVSLSSPAGVDTIGLYDGSTAWVHLRNSNSTGVADIEFFYGPGANNWIPVTGDWNGDGVDTIGLYDQATAMFHLRNSHTTGVADISFYFGPGGTNWKPIAGDWNGDGIDTIGLYDSSSAWVHLRNSNTTGGADISFFYGPGANPWVPVAGDWNNDGVDSIGLYDQATAMFHLRNSHTTGVADISFYFGPGGTNWKPIKGDWDADGDDTIGLYDASSAWVHLRNSNTTGGADNSFFYGPGANNWGPVAGDWDNL